MQDDADARVVEWRDIEVGLAAPADPCAVTTLHDGLERRDEAAG